MDKSRKRFEGWYQRVGGNSSINPDGKYTTERARLAWWSWQASRAAIEIELPDKVFVEDDFDSGHNMAIDYCAESITSLGLKVKP